MTTQICAFTTLLYGGTGTYKTTNAGQFAQYIMERYGKKTRYVTAEAAGIEPMTPYIKSGFVIPLFFSQALQPRSAMKKLVRGCWPRGIDANGRPTNDPEKVVRLAWRDDQKRDFMLSPQELQETGAYIFEGLTSIDELCLDQVAKSGFIHRTTGTETGMASTGYEEEGEVLASNQKSHYGAVQRDTLAWLEEAPKQLFVASLGSVQHILWTAHEAKGEDEFGGRTVYGVGSAGKAIIRDIERKVGALLHTQ
ncbi:MAG: hypothetical protein ACREIQ_02815, partial [Nitrospiria bacterium]